MNPFAFTIGVYSRLLNLACSSSTVVLLNNANSTIALFKPLKYFLAPLNKNASNVAVPVDATTDGLL